MVTPRGSRRPCARTACAAAQVVLPHHSTRSNDHASYVLVTPALCPVACCLRSGTHRDVRRGLLVEGVELVATLMEVGPGLHVHGLDTLPSVGFMFHGLTLCQP
uniref:Uncharacterized protein n=1 Tax=Chlamydomonas euryale TaxID=1486919 RepID=A0A7R9UZR3_9CHLO|eukprot:360158-Chlamydomonas_euryale.AAC.1